MAGTNLIILTSICCWRRNFYAINSGVTIYDISILFGQLKILDYDASIVFMTLKDFHNCELYDIVFLQYRPQWHEISAILAFSQIISNILLRILIRVKTS